MKATELMIGDWVQWIIEDIPVQVTSLSQSSIDFDTNRCLYDCDVDEFAPIPLTAEILEKNGFHEYGESWYIPCEENEDCIMVGFHRRYDCLDVYKNKDYNYRQTFKKGELYVHQLQHALRLCGIDKEVVI